jgi:hypothetical protein
MTPPTWGDSENHFEYIHKSVGFKSEHTVWCVFSCKVIVHKPESVGLNRCNYGKGDLFIYTFFEVTLLRKSETLKGLIGFRVSDRFWLITSALVF